MRTFTLLSNEVRRASRPAHLEQLDSDAGEHEVQQHGDQHDVPDGLDGDEHTLDDVLQADAQRSSGSGPAAAHGAQRRVSNTRHSAHSQVSEGHTRHQLIGGVYDEPIGGGAVL